MPRANLARLDPVPLREAWASEAGDFTPWLASKENLKLLGEAIGLELELEKQEHAVDQYRADIVCRELDNNQRVVIENQIEETDHKHLGQILTYAAGVDARIMVWIAQNFTDAHRAAIDWLNERANGSAGFFGVEIELYRIGNSPPAPRFNVVSKPNDWANQVKQSVAEGGYSETEQTRAKYWTAMVASLQAAKFGLNCYKPSAKSYLKVKLPIAGYSAGFEVYVPDGVSAVYFGTYELENKKALRHIIQRHQQAIEDEIGQKIEVTDNGDNKPFWIESYITSHLTDDKDWPHVHEWLRVTLEKLIAAISKRLAQAAKA